MNTSRTLFINRENKRKKRKNVSNIPFYSTVLIIKVLCNPYSKYYIYRYLITDVYMLQETIYSSITIANT